MYFLTHSGKCVDIETMSEEDICLQDIAHHLTGIRRYGGALPLGEHYSVACHSLYLTIWAINNSHGGIGFHRALLMHDAAEAYLGDLVSDVKAYCPDYKKLEKKVEALIINKYKLPKSDLCWSLVKELDTRIVLDEARAFFPEYYHVFLPQLPQQILPLGMKIEGSRNLQDTKKLFLEMCYRLNIRD